MLHCGQWLLLGFILILEKASLLYLMLGNLDFLATEVSEGNISYAEITS